MGEYTPEAGANVTLYRLGELAKTVQALVKWRGEVDVERERLRNDAKTLAEDMKDVKQSVDTLRKTILGFALTIAASTVVFALTILSSSGRL